MRLITPRTKPWTGIKHELLSGSQSKTKQNKQKTVNKIQERGKKERVNRARKKLLAQFLAEKIKDLRILMTFQLFQSCWIGYNIQIFSFLVYYVSNTSARRLISLNQVWPKAFDLKTLDNFRSFFFTVTTNMFSKSIKYIFFYFSATKIALWKG